MVEKTLTIHVGQIPRFTAVVDGAEVACVRASDYEDMRAARDMVAREADGLAAKLEVAEAAAKAAVSQAQWQARTNGELNALQARLAEAERDAARYRWLRDGYKMTSIMAVRLRSLPIDGEMLYWQALDTAIDAAMASETVDGAK